MLWGGIVSSVQFGMNWVEVTILLKLNDRFKRWGGLWVDPYEVSMAEFS